MIEPQWLIVGVLTGLILGTVFIPPTRKSMGVPRPGDSETFFTETGCVRFEAVEVPCTAEPDSLNLLAAQK